MRCKRHPADLTSTVGVCASCLRHRLFLLIAAHSRPDPPDEPLPPPPPPFPRSVSPYVSRRRSYSTPPPHLHPSSCARSFNQNNSSFSLLSRLFRSRSDQFNSDPRSSSSPSSSWLSTVFSSRRRKQPKICFIEDAIAGDRTRRRPLDRGMSPALGSESEEEYDPPASIGVSPGRWTRRTPARWPRTNVSRLGICLSPLLRASPSGHRSQKGDMAAYYSAEMRAPAKPHLSTAASFCANRSRKLADFGRPNHNH